MQSRLYVSKSSVSLLINPLRHEEQSCACTFGHLFNDFNSLRQRNGSHPKRRLNSTLENCAERLSNQIRADIRNALPLAAPMGRKDLQLLVFIKMMSLHQPFQTHSNRCAIFRLCSQLPVTSSSIHDQDSRQNPLTPAEWIWTTVHHLISSRLKIG